MDIPRKTILLAQQLLPEDSFSGLVRLLKRNLPGALREKAIRAWLDDMDPCVRQECIGELITRLLPVTELVPPAYAHWRPLVSDAIRYIGGNLSTTRLAVKLSEQIDMPAGVTVQKRFIAFISQMPSLQKLGQVIARNRNLSNELRHELMGLENGIRDVSASQVQAIIREQLKPLLDKFQVEIDTSIHAEATVAAVVKFSWSDTGSGVRKNGVLKVLKPFIRDYFQEEMALLGSLADFLDQSSNQHILSKTNLRGIFDEVRVLLEKEIDFINEQANLRAAAMRYDEMEGVRIPCLLPRFCTAEITAMSEEDGQKVTGAFANERFERIRLSTRIIEALVAVPLFSRKNRAVFHADAHAGNLFVDEDSGELIILDWALTDTLDREQRRQIILLIFAFLLRDSRMMFNAVDALSEDSLMTNGEKSALVRRAIRDSINDIAVITVPGVKHVLTLLDNISLLGISFSGSLLIFRKLLMTLDGVLHDVAGLAQIESVLAQYMTRQVTGSVFQLQPLSPEGPEVDLPVSLADMASLFWSSQWYGLRTGVQLGQQMQSGRFNIWGT